MLVMDFWKICACLAERVSVDNLAASDGWPSIHNTCWWKCCHKHWYDGPLAWETTIVTGMMWATGCVTKMRCTSHIVAFPIECCHWKASFAIGKKIAKAKIALLLSVNSNGSNRQVLIMVENHWSHVVLETKSSCENYANKEQGRPWTICT